MATHPIKSSQSCSESRQGKVAYPEGPQVAPEWHLLSADCPQHNGKRKHVRLRWAHSLRKVREVQGSLPCSNSLIIQGSSSPLAWTCP